MKGTRWARDFFGAFDDQIEAHALVLSIDDKSQIQALNRTQPGLPLKPGNCGTMTHDYKRGNRQVSVPMAQAIIRSLAVSAAKGNQRAQRLFSELLVTTEREHKQLHDEWLNEAIEYKVSWDRELERRKQLGITAPDPLPHPDDIIIDMRAGAVRLKGPMTREEKAEWDWIRGRKAEFQAELTELQQMLRDDPDHEHRKIIEDDIAHAKRILEIIRKAIPD